MRYVCVHAVVASTCLPQLAYRFAGFWFKLSSKPVCATPNSAAISERLPSDQQNNSEPLYVMTDPHKVDFQVRIADSPPLPPVITAMNHCCIHQG